MSEAKRKRAGRRRIVAAVLAIGIAIGTVEAAGAEIVLQRSIAGVELGMTKAAVRGILGEPRRIIRGTNEFGQFTAFRYSRLQVSFQGNTTVTHLRTNRLSERTAEEVGVGTTRAGVLDRVTGVRCRPGFCFVGRFLPGRRVTVFRICDGIVTRVEIGFVID
jgi:hypothetical protein